jgi:hypothetical protein
MRRKGSPWNNAACKSFMKTLKYVLHNECRDLTRGPRFDRRVHREGLYPEMPALGAGQCATPPSFEAQRRKTWRPLRGGLLSGDFIEQGKSYGPGAFFVGKAGTSHGPHNSVSGCTVLTTFSASLDFQIGKPDGETT